MQFGEVGMQHSGREGLPLFEALGSIPSIAKKKKKKEKIEKKEIGSQKVIIVNLCKMS